MSSTGCVINRIVVLLFFISALAAAGCQREISFETPPPSTGNGSGNGNGAGAGSGTGTLSGTSKFILVPTGRLCSDAVVHGSYLEKKALTLVDFVILTVEVVQPGTWSYNTGTVNGFRFANSGNFTATGKQQIILVASGTPVTAGVSEFPLSIGTAPCSFKVAVKTFGGATRTPGEYYYKATIGGVNYTESVTDPGDYEAGSGLGGMDDVYFTAGIFHTADPIPLGVTSFGIRKGIMSNYLRATDAQFKAFFAPGTYPYTYTGNDNGIAIGWLDKQGRSWGSTHDSIKQPSTSTFKIISVEDSYDVIGNYYIKVKMQFNCTLFRDSSNDKVELKNGEMVGLFGKI